jgi:hypothetical protein
MHHRSGRAEDHPAANDPAEMRGTMPRDYRDEIRPVRE